MTVPNYEGNSQTIAVLEGFIRLMLEASDHIESVLGKPLEFDPDGTAYGDDVIGVFVMQSGPKPAMAVTVSTYISNPNVAPGLTEYGIQIRARSANRDYRPAMFMLDTFREHDEYGINGRAYQDLGGYVATAIVQQSIGDMGLNNQDQYELTENYYATVNDKPGEDFPSPRTE